MWQDAWTDVIIFIPIVITICHVEVLLQFDFLFHCFWEESICEGGMFRASFRPFACHQLISFDNNSDFEVVVIFPHKDAVNVALVVFITTRNLIRENQLSIFPDFFRAIFICFKRKFSVDFPEIHRFFIFVINGKVNPFCIYRWEVGINLPFQSDF